MNLETAKQLVRTHFKFPPLSAPLAETAIHNYLNGYIHLPEEFQGQLFLALQIIRDQDMGSEHHNDDKRRDRARGKQRRKARTGSRR